MAKYKIDDLLRDNIYNEIEFKIVDVLDGSYSIIYTKQNQYVNEGQTNIMLISLIDNGSSLIGQNDKTETKETTKVSTCNHTNKYFNVLSASLKFWVCPDCGQDLGD